MKEKMVTTREVHYKLWVQGKAYYVLSDSFANVQITDHSAIVFLATPCETETKNGLVHELARQVMCAGGFVLEELGEGGKEISVFEMLDVEQDKNKEPDVPEPSLSADYAVVDPGNGEEYAWTSLQ